MNTGFRRWKEARTDWKTSDMTPMGRTERELIAVKGVFDDKKYARSSFNRYPYRWNQDGGIDRRTALHFPTLRSRALPSFLQIGKGCLDGDRRD